VISLVLILFVEKVESTSESEWKHFRET